MRNDLTSGNIVKTILLFAGPMMIGNLLQQIYNISDTLIVGHFLGENALAAVGSTYTFTTFLYSIIIGLCMGSGSLISYYCGERNLQKQKTSIAIAFIFIGIISVIIEIITLSSINQFVKLLKTPYQIVSMTTDYVQIILLGIIFVFLYNYYAYILRAFGNSITPLIFLGIASILNIVLDILFVVYLDFGIKGAAYATLFAQIVSGVGLAIYSFIKEPNLHINFSNIHFQKNEIFEVFHMSFAASVQQSVMNFGILMIQGLVNSFGTTVMAGFTIAVKIDTIAYMPAQEFGNAFSLFISQNYGAKKHNRIQEGIKKSFLISGIFCIVVSIIVVLFSKNLMRIFIDRKEIDIIQTGTQYLIIEGMFYIGIGILFLLYGYYRGIHKPEISLILTVISLGTRVALAYFLSQFQKIGVCGIWVSIPIGWFLADIIGILYMKICNKQI